jgi:hypothetical protein
MIPFDANPDFNVGSDVQPHTDRAYLSALNKQTLYIRFGVNYSQPHLYLLETSADTPLCPYILPHV